MRTPRIILASLVTAGLVMPVSPATAQTHDHGVATELSLTLNQGQKWQGDENMVKGMQGIRNAIVARQDAIHDGTLPQAEYAAVASEIQSQVDFMVENCKLEPAADEQLHMVLGEVLNGTSAIEEGAAPQAGVETIVNALNSYGEHFAHPGWTPLR